MFRAKNIRIKEVTFALDDAILVHLGRVKNGFSRGIDVEQYALYKLLIMNMTDLYVIHILL